MLHCMKDRTNYEKIYTDFMHSPSHSLLQLVYFVLLGNTLYYIVYLTNMLYSRLICIIDVVINVNLNDGSEGMGGRMMGGWEGT